MIYKKNSTYLHWEFIGVLIFVTVCTLIMIALNAFERLYIFTRSFTLFGFDEFTVFSPSFIAIGFIYFSLRRIKELESEITRRTELEKKLIDSEKKYKELSITDELTQLYNSRFLYHKIQ